MTAKKTDGDVPSKAEIDEARKEGVLEKVKESANTMDMDALKGDEPETDRYVGKDEIMQFAYMVDLSLDQLKEALKIDADNALPDNKVAGLLGLERGGKNRTDFVKAYMDRLKKANPKLKTPYDVTNAGPPYTNDVTNITEF